MMKLLIAALATVAIAFSAPSAQAQPVKDKLVTAKTSQPQKKKCDSGPKPGCLERSINAGWSMREASSWCSRPSTC